MPWRHSATRPSPRDNSLETRGFADRPRDRGARNELRAPTPNAVIQGAVRASFQRPSRRLRFRLPTAGPPPGVIGDPRYKHPFSWRRPITVQLHQAITTQRQLLDLGSQQPLTTALTSKSPTCRPDWAQLRP